MIGTEWFGVIQGNSEAGFGCAFLDADGLFFFHEYIRQHDTTKLAVIAERPSK